MLTFATAIARAGIEPGSDPQFPKTDMKIVPSLSHDSKATRPPWHPWSPQPSGSAGIPTSHRSPPTGDHHLIQVTRGSKAAAGFRSQGHKQDPRLPENPLKGSPDTPLSRGDKEH